MENLRSRTNHASIKRCQELQHDLAKILVQEVTYGDSKPICIGWRRDISTPKFSICQPTPNVNKRVVKPVNEANVVITDQEGLFKAVDGNHDLVLSLIKPRVTNEDNERLSTPILKEEIHTALMQIHPYKSPGHDSFNSAFYQHFWSLCGDDIFSVVRV
jgi:hypothetical protein